MIAVGYVAALGVVLPGRRKSSEVSRATGATEVAHSVNTAEATAAAEKAGVSEQSGDAGKLAKTHKLSLANFIEVRALPVSVAITVGYLAYGALSPTSIRTRLKWGLQAPRASFSCRIPLPCS